MHSKALLAPGCLRGMRRYLRLLRVHFEIYLSVWTTGCVDTFGVEVLTEGAAVRYGVENYFTNIKRVYIL